MSGNKEVPATEWMRKYRERKRKEKLLKNGQCPECEMSLKPEYFKFHQGCKYLKELARNNGFIGENSIES